MKVIAKVIVASLTSACLAMGCGPNVDKDLTLVSATGTVTYNGSALAGATVTFMPDKGPLAIGITDLSGNFKLNSGAIPGCAVGPAKVAVTAVPPSDNASSSANFNTTSAMTPEESAARSKKMADMTIAYQTDANKSKSLIPERYKDAVSSGLQFTVESDAAKNNFKIELKD